MRIGIIVPGRFHAFEVARELQALGHEVHIRSNYPYHQAERFGIAKTNYRNLVLQRVAAKLGSMLSPDSQWPEWLESRLMTWFGTWAARSLRSVGDLDLLYLFSGAALPALQLDFPGRPLKLVARGSSHIDTQDQLLADEGVRAGLAVARPSNWMRVRERREYLAGDHVEVLSTFARDSFLAQGFPPERVHLNTLGCDTSVFAVAPDTLLARRTRLLRGDRLQVLSVGSFSLRKGAFDLVHIARAFKGQMDFTMVGDIGGDAVGLAKQAQLEGLIRFQPRVPQSELPSLYALGDVFLFPTIEDGFAMTLAQALVSGLTVLSTPNCCAADLIENGRNGVLVAARDAQGFCNALRALDADRARTAQIADQGASTKIRSWREVANGVISLATKLRAGRA